MLLDITTPGRVVVRRRAGFVTQAKAEFDHRLPLFTAPIWTVGGTIAGMDQRFDMAIPVSTAQTIHCWQRRGGIRHRSRIHLGLQGGNALLIGIADAVQRTGVCTTRTGVATV